MGDNVSFKVYLKTGEEQEEEVRRFVIDKGASTSYDYLVGKLEVVFPQIKTSTFSIHWTDEDGDNVTITSDEELIIALTEMSGPLYKLRVNIKKTKPVVTGQESEATGSSSAVHYGVTCDGCECKPIIGNRYKCVVCDDFDLCETCHAAGKHPGHNMMKITEPGYVFPQRLFKRMQTLQERAKNLSERQQRKEEKKEARGQSCPARGVGPRGRGLFRPFGPMHGGRGGAWAASAVPAFDAMMKGWTGEGMFANNGWSGQNTGSEEHKRAHEEAMNAAKAAHEQAHAAAADAAKASADASAALNAAFEGVNLTGSEDYLKNVGNFVAAALDPLGIDVKIDIETPEGRKSCQVSSATSSSSSTTTTVEDKEDATKKDEEAVVEDQDKEPEASKKASTPSDDEEEWTVVSDKKDKEDDHQGSLYPDLSETKPEEAATESSPIPTAPVANHPDPRIQVALQAMMNMGFTNDGGWLSSLLEAKNGDIGKVLDILQPVKK